MTEKRRAAIMKGVAAQQQKRNKAWRIRSLKAGGSQHGESQIMASEARQ
jgi:hypothetical protein